MHYNPKDIELLKYQKNITEEEINNLLEDWIELFDSNSQMKKFSSYPLKNPLEIVEENNKRWGL